MKGYIVIITLIIIICNFYICNNKKIKKMKISNYVLIPESMLKTFSFLKPMTKNYYIKFLESPKKYIYKINGRKKKEKENVEHFLNDPKEETFLILDGSSILFKNFFGMPYLKTNDDINISTIYGFIQSLNKIYKLFFPKYVLIVFDSKSSNNEKKKLFSKYKMLRKKKPEELYEQLNIVSKFCHLIGIKTIIVEETEGDNYIAEIVGKTYNTMKNECIKEGINIMPGITKDAENGEKKKEEYNEVAVKVKEEDKDSRSLRVVIVSNDKDLLQMLEYDGKLKNLKIRVCQPNKKYKIFDTQKFIEEYELAPNQYSDFLIMAGDKSDCISGIPQIGDKTSKSLLKKYKNIDEILNNLHNLPEKLYNIFINNIENIKIFKSLIKLKCETSQFLILNDYKQTNIKDFDAYQTFLEKYALNKLMHKSVLIDHKGGL